MGAGSHGKTSVQIATLSVLELFLHSFPDSGNDWHAVQSGYPHVYPFLMGLHCGYYGGMVPVRPEQEEI